jgi:hypothetical protein
VIADGAILPNKLVEPLSDHNTLAVGIDIGAMAVAGRRAIYRDAEANGTAFPRGAENEVEIARVEPVDDAALFLIEDGAFFVDRPIA